MVRRTHLAPRGRPISTRRPGTRDADGANNHTEENRTEALRLHGTGISNAAIGRALGIPRTTISRWVHNPDMVLGRGRTCTLAPWEENMIVSAFNFVADVGLPLGRETLLKVVKGYCLAIGKPTPFHGNGGIPGPDWLVDFRGRHHGELRLRVTEYLSRARYDAMSPHNMDTYFNRLEVLYTQNPDWHEFGHLVFNLDETSLGCDRTDSKVFVNVVRQSAFKVVADGSKLAFTLLVCCNAGGARLPPFILYRAKTMNPAWVENGFPGAAYGVSNSGWMCAINFEGWFRDIFVPYVKRACGGKKVLLTFDGHRSHVTYNTIIMAQENNITLLCLPANSSHATQPLDVGVFNHMKRQWKDILKVFYDHPARKVTKEALPPLVNLLWEGWDATYAINGFRMTGLFPLSRQAVQPKVIPSPEDVLAAGNSGAYIMSKDAKTDELIKQLTTICKQTYDNIISPPAGAQDAAGPSGQAPPKRQRIQIEPGTVLTEESTAQRIREQEEAKVAKKLKIEENKRIRAENKLKRQQAQLAKALASAQKAKEKAAKKGVHIQMKPVKKPPKSLQDKKGVRALTDFFGKLKRVATDNSQSSEFVLDTPSPSDADSRSLQVDKAQQPKVHPPKRTCRIKKEVNYLDKTLQSDSADSDVDDPPVVSSGDPKFDISDLSTGDYVIYKLGNSHFPGKVLKVYKKQELLDVFTMIPLLDSHYKHWTWPKNERATKVSVNNIVHKINAPRPVYFSVVIKYEVEEIAKYYPQSDSAFP